MAMATANASWLFRMECSSNRSGEDTASRAMSMLRDYWRAGGPREPSAGRLNFARWGAVSFAIARIAGERLGTDIASEGIAGGVDSSRAQ